MAGVGAGSFDKLRMNGGRGGIGGLGTVGRWQFWWVVVRLMGLDFYRGRRLADGFDGFGD